MPRKTLIRSELFPYHITGRVNNQDPFPVPLPLMWDLITTDCLSIQSLFDFRIHAFVLMPNHFHLIGTPSDPEQDLGRVMQYFMSSITKNCHRFSGRTGRLFGDKYFWSIVTSSRYYGHVLKYVYRNPVKADLVKTVEEYEFSTLRGLIGLQRSPFPIHYTECGLEFNIPNPEERFQWVNWLNTPFPSESEKLVQELMRKKEIRVFLDRNTRKPVPLLEQLL